MSAKARFLKKLQEQKPGRDAYANREQADIAEFCRRMGALQEHMEGWLTGAGIRIEYRLVMLSEFLIGGGTFSVPEICLHYDDRTLRFTPVFLYAQGVTGGVDATLFADGKTIPLRRLFMRSTEETRNWTCTPSGSPVGERVLFTEEVFFDTIGSLLG